MSSAMSTENSENTCVVCFKNVEIYSIGDCDHPVCYECSTRMRVICVQNDCPICRQDMPKVLFTKNVRPFKECASWQCLVDEKYKICFENSSIKNDYERLLEHRCPKCRDKVFSTFSKLSDHMTKAHQLFYCDLCVENLKIFTFERRAYNRHVLGLHRRKGDADDLSHKGHPNCDFCDCRFMDNDTLFRHLRRDHYYCHICDANGLNCFYPSYRVLREHYRTEHFLCEEGNCINEEFTSVFSTEIDLKAHIATSHTSGMTKAASKQARTLDLEFTLARRPQRPDRGHRDDRGYREYRGGGGGAVGGGGGDQGNAERPPSHQSDEEAGAVGGVSMRGARKPQLNLNEFPSLGAERADRGPEAPSATLPGAMMQRSNGRRGFTISAMSRGPPVINDADYPALGPSDSQAHSKTVRVSVNSKSQPAVSIQVNRVGRASGPPQPPPPSAPNAQPAKPAGTSSGTSKRPSRPPGSAFDADYYPPLTPLAAYQGTSSTEWVSTSAKTERGKTQAQSKVQVLSASTVANINTPPPPPPASQQSTPGQSARYYERNFPSLGPSAPAAAPQNSNPKWKKSSVTIPISNTWSTNNNNTTAQSSDNESNSFFPLNAKSKKKKKKGGKGNEIPKLTNGTDSNDKKKPAQVSPKKSPENTKLLNGGHVQQGSTQERKRSELEIDNLHLNTDAHSSPADPTDRLLSLIRGDSSASSKPGPPGFDRGDRGSVDPPPGFNSGFPPGFVRKPPPPGFEANMQMSNGLTFTSSSGESYPIQPYPNARYLQPDNFQARNASLKSKVSEALNRSEAGNPKSDFKDMSIMYRTGMLPVDVYYDYCKVSLGEKAFADILPELICLLPDITRQQELYRVHMESSRSGTSQSKSKKKSLEVCSNCGQVLKTSDLSSHSASHQLDSQFPSLSLGVAAPAGQAGPAGAWNRK